MIYSTSFCPNRLTLYSPQQFPVRLLQTRRPLDAPALRPEPWDALNSLICDRNRNILCIFQYTTFPYIFKPVLFPNRVRP